MPLAPPALIQPQSLPAAGQPERDARLVTMLVIGRLVTARGDALCRVRNVSSGGLMLESGLVLNPGEDVRVELRSGRVLHGAVVWTEPPRAGLRFADPQDVAGLLGPSVHVRLAPRRPRAPRLSAACPVLLRIHQGEGKAELADLSQSGCRLCVMPGLVRAGQEITLSVPALGAKRGLVRWARDDQAGIAFATPIGFDALDAWLARPDQRFAQEVPG